MRRRSLLLAVGGIAAALWLVHGSQAVDPEPVGAITLPAARAAAPAAPERTPFAGDDRAARRALAREIDAAISTGRYGRADWGVLVFSLDHGDTLYAHEAERALAPASNMKLATSVAALHHLGGDFRFRTWALSDAPVVDGVLQGDLVLYGTGDPGIADRFWPDRAEPWRVMARQLRDAGIHGIAGRVLGDGTFFAGPGVLTDLWEAEDLNEWYGAATGGLGYNENVASLRIEPSANGLPPIVHSVPDHTGQAILNDGETVGGAVRDRIAFLREDPTDPIRVTGQIRIGTPDVWRQMAIGDPALFAAHGLTHVLRDEGIEVRNDPSTVSSARTSAVTPRRVWGAGEGDVRILAELRSPPISEYLTAVNQRSHNLYADALLKTLGRALEGQGSFAAGSRAVTRFMVEELGVPADQVHIVDGSGLSETNRLSPRALVALLDHAETEGYAGVLEESLAEAGTRTLRRMSLTAAARNLRAKTGTISGVSALSGIVRARDGERLAFSIIGNDLPSETGAKRIVEDRVGAFLADWSRGRN